MHGLLIKRALNGWTLKHFCGDKPPEVSVLEENESDAKTTQRLLYEIMYMLGIQSSKHDEERVRVICVDQEDKVIED